jgi:hypothetical protein
MDEDDGSVWSEDIWMEACQSLGEALDWAAIDKSLDEAEGVRG